MTGDKKEWTDLTELVISIPATNEQLTPTLNCLIDLAITLNKTVCL